MFHAATREGAIKGIAEILTHSRICGPPTNLEFLATILQDPEFKLGNTTTKFLSSFKFAPSAIGVVAGGAYTLIEEYPGRPTVGRGFRILVRWIHSPFESLTSLLAMLRARKDWRVHSVDLIYNYWGCDCGTVRGAGRSKAGRKALFDVGPCEDQPRPKADGRQDNRRRLQVIPRRLWRLPKCCRMVRLEIDCAHDGRRWMSRKSSNFWRLFRSRERPSRDKK